DPHASLGHSPGVGVGPQDLPGPVLEPPIPPGGPAVTGPIGPEIDPAANRPGAVRAKSRIVSAMWRLVITLILVVALACVGVLASSKMGVDILPPQHMQKIHSYA